MIFMRTLAFPPSTPSADDNQYSYNAVAVRDPKVDAPKPSLFRGEHVCGFFGI